MNGPSFEIVWVLSRSPESPTLTMWTFGATQTGIGTQLAHSPARTASELVVKNHSSATASRRKHANHSHVRSAVDAVTLELGS